MLNKYYENAINDAIMALKDDGVIIVPTDTVYGFACLSSSKVAIERIYDIKGRKREKLLPIIVNSYKMLESVADIDINKVKKLEKYFPGPLTLVCKRKASFDYFMADTIAIRMINSSLINQLIDILQEPLALTSANISSEEIITDPMELLERFDGAIDCIFIGSKMDKVPSTIVEVKDDHLVLIREGKIPFDLIVKEYEHD